MLQPKAKVAPPQPTPPQNVPPLPVRVEAPLQPNIEPKVAPLAQRSVLDEGEVGKVVAVKLAEGLVMKFAWCPPGSFTMGSPKDEKDRYDDEDQVQVRLSRGFWMGQTPCTQAQWEAVMGSNPSCFKGSDLPVEQVSWEDTQEFLEKLNGKVRWPAGWKAALPTEAQWEYACRAGTESVFGFGDSLSSRQANFDGRSPYGGGSKGPYLEKTSPVGSYAANAWGLYDLHGNVCEWCADWYRENLPGGTDPTGPATSNNRLRVLRGGSWLVSAGLCRSAYRFGLTPVIRSGRLGFRLCLFPGPETSPGRGAQRSREAKA